MRYYYCRLFITLILHIVIWKTGAWQMPTRQGTACGMTVVDLVKHCKTSLTMLFYVAKL